MTRPRVRVVIRSLHVDGTVTRDGAALAVNLRSELAALLAREGVAPDLLQTSRHHPQLSVPAPPIRPGTPATAVGARVAAAVHRGLYR